VRRDVEGQDRCVNCDSRERGADEQSAVDLKRRSRSRRENGRKSDVLKKRKQNSAQTNKSGQKIFACE
jgi:hypothetical protein